ncbi:uncharacterized protein DDB_G0271670 [Topomyia yanbarensis]|uniref:uncharacterized protein DDB_G0271670 n=1 Tax=Topomyia yanbarensis TaxID=2498891 RepID=UPI00273BD6EA|nr:uncharacterized protein DDB_G0271670 [Topomyia yanbarensis]XP_058818576.1 uncharacterized protein DDB_G0271670 [Topomyia yanbarensis]
MDVDSPNSLKRCSSAPHINNLLPTTVVGVHSSVVPMDVGQSHQDTPSEIPAVAQTQSTVRPSNSGFNQQQQQSPQQLHAMSSSSTSNLQTAGVLAHRDPPPTSFSNIFTPRARRFSASFSPLAVISNGSSSPSRSGSCTPGPRLTPRISQLRQEECADLSNSREVNHEREIHSAMQMSQSYEDLTLVTENWSFSSSTKNDDLVNPLHVALPSIGTNYCSSPSPTSRGGLGLQYPTTSPSPTRKFVTRRSMSPCPIRPSPLSSSVKRKFDLDENYVSSYSPPPMKKIFTSDRGSSPVCQTPSPSPICPSPDSSTASFENGSNNVSNSGRITPKFFVTKLSTSAAGSSLFGGGSNGAAGGTAIGINNATSLALPLHTDSPPPSSSSSSPMMMDCGVSSSSGHNPLEADNKLGQQNMTVSSSEGTKIDCDEDITDLNAVASSTSIMTTESSETVMSEALKAPRSLENSSESELLDSSSNRLSTSSNTSNDNNSKSNSSLCPLAFGSSTSNGSGAFLTNNVEIAET